MSDTAVGFVLIGIVMLVVLGAVFIISTRGGPRQQAPGHGGPPAGVHMPASSILPVVISVGMALVGAGLVFAPEDQVANLFILIPGIIVVIVVIVAWVRAANREWRDVDHGVHEDGASH